MGQKVIWCRFQEDFVVPTGTSTQCMCVDCHTDKCKESCQNYIKLRSGNFEKMCTECMENSINR